MKEIVVISGKGGTGKTSLTASFAVIGGKSMVVCDCDVDADDMHLLLNPDYKISEDFYSGFKARIDEDQCHSCGKCVEVCRFDAVKNIDNNFIINEINCEGCGYCAEVCPSQALTLNEACVGELYTSTIKTGARMIHARLKAGADNSGKLVAKVKKQARISAESMGKNIILVDGSPGIGCPVISSLTGADYAILVTEPSPSGLHDLKRVYQLVRNFKIKSGLIINKNDINPSLADELMQFAVSEGISFIAEIPWVPDFTKAMTDGLTAAEYKNEELKNIIAAAWAEVEKEISSEDTE